MAAVLSAAYLLGRTVLATESPHSESAIARGREVYISEGCMSCHSQYVRPHTADVLMWGPVETVEELHRQRPPLIGNRRQGPDLSQVGGRRSPLWLKAHFFQPGEVSHASFMPSYAYLFRDSPRGNDLVAYLASLKSSDYSQHIAVEQAWMPASEDGASAEDGVHLFGRYCVTCHAATGATRHAWQTEFRRLPPVLPGGPWLHVQVAQPSGERFLELARIIKFGIPETDMPGHEYLPDSDVVSIALWLNQNIVGSELHAVPHRSGENQ